MAPACHCVFVAVAFVAEQLLLLQSSRSASTGAWEELGGLDHAALLSYFAAALRGLDLGRADSESVMFSLKASFERRYPRAVLVDVGANTGQSLSALARLFGAGMLGGKRRGQVPVVIHAFEPNPGSFALLQGRGECQGKAVACHLVEAAVLDSPGHHTLFFNSDEDLHGSLSFFTRGLEAASTQANVTTREVEVVTLDSAFSPDVFIHLLKVDTEGFDPLVLRGARGLLSRKRVKFLVFEYHYKWWLAGHGLTLKDVIAELLEKEYVCFLITEETLIPLSGAWWQDSYEIYKWSNVFCGQQADHDLFDAYVSYGTNRHTLSYALANLKLA